MGRDMSFAADMGLELVEGALLLGYTCAYSSLLRPIVEASFLIIPQGYARRKNLETTEYVCT